MTSADAIRCMRASCTSGNLDTVCLASWREVTCRIASLLLSSLEGNLTLKNLKFQTELRAGSPTPPVVPCHLVFDQCAGQTLHQLLLLLLCLLTLQHLGRICGAAVEGCGVASCLALPLLKPVAATRLGWDLVCSGVCYIGCTVPGCKTRQGRTKQSERLHCRQGGKDGERVWGFSHHC